MRHSRPEANTAASCSDRCYQLEAMKNRELEDVFLRGSTPDLDSLVGWTFRGTNTPRWARLAGIKKFVKGFFRDSDGDTVYGYNSPAVQNDLRAPWIRKPSDDDPKRFGFFKVAPVDPTSRDNAYLHAVLLDYGAGGNKAWDPTRGLRDYLVQVDADNPDLYLGKAYYRLGPLAPATSYFILERHLEGPASLDR